MMTKLITYIQPSLRVPWFCKGCSIKIVSRIVLDIVSRKKITSHESRNWSPLVTNSCTGREMITQIVILSHGAFLKSSPGDGFVQSIRSLKLMHHGLEECPGQSVETPPKIKITFCQRHPPRRISCFPPNQWIVALYL